MATILVSIALILLAAAAGLALWQDKKHGKSACGGNCASCAGCSACRQPTADAKRSRVRG